MTLTKSEMVNRIHERLGFKFSHSHTHELVEVLLEIMKEKLENGEDVLISGFGKFCVKEKNERRGRNPASGDEMMLRARRIVSFKCSSLLRESVNGVEEKK